MKKNIIIITLLISILLLTISFGVNKEEVKEEKVAEKNISLPNTIQAYTYEGEKADKTYEWLLSNKIVKKITCKNGTMAKFNYEDSSVSLSNIHMPDYCTIDFKEGYLVSLNATNGTVSAPTSQTTGYNGTVTFTVTSNTGSTELTKNTCSGVLSGNTFTISNIKESKNCEIEFKKSNMTLYSQILADNENRGDLGDHTTLFEEDCTGYIFEENETDSTVYYFAGDIKNNWVKFGNYLTDDPDGKWSKGDPIYWRIIRTNADGSVRMLYSGNSPSTTEGYIGTSEFNSLGNSSMYVGYKYGTSGTLASNRTNENDSTIKTFIDNWYINNLSSYTKYISTEAVYCNDRQLSSGSTYNNYTLYFYKNILNDDGSYASYYCDETKDAFSGNNTEAKLTYPIGLMTVDEAVIAGCKAGEYCNLWYNRNSVGGSITGSAGWWLLTPDSVQVGNSYMWSVNMSYPGGISTCFADTNLTVRPVISIKGDVLLSKGDGSSENPYEIVYN